jgi:mRNA interferase RelE/StbE
MYELKFTISAVNSLKKIDKTVVRRIVKRIEWIAENIDQIKPVSLKGDFPGLYKLRIGNYRVIYDIDFDKLKITIHFVGHRSKIYKNK